MTVDRTTTHSHFEACKAVLITNPCDASKYLAFRVSCFDSDDTLRHHYYRLNRTDKERLEAFFTHRHRSNKGDAPIATPTKEAFSSRRNTTSHEHCNLRIINAFNHGHKELSDVEKVTINLLSKVTQMEDALRLLNNLDQIRSRAPPSSPYNKCINRCFALHSDHKAAFDNILKILNLMVVKKVEPDLITAMNFLVACAECGELEAAKRLLFGVDDQPSWLSRWGLTPDIALCSVYLTVCAKTGKFSEAYEFLIADSSNNMQRRWPDAKPPIKPNLITAMNFLVACAECGEFEAAKQLLFNVDGKSSWLSQWGLTPNIALCSVYLTVCAKTGKFNEAYEFLNIDSPNSMQQRWPNAKPPIKPNLITAMNFLVACAECGEFEAAKQLLFDVDGQPSWLSRWGLTPDIALGNVYLTVCAKTGKFSEVYEFLIADSSNNMQRRWPDAKPPIKPNLITATNFLVACAECGEFEAAKQLLFNVDGKSSWLSQWGLTPNIALCSVYLTVCAKTGKFSEAYEFLNIDSPNSMQQRWPDAKPLIKPDLITAMNFLVACAECGELEAAKRLLFGVDDQPSWLSRWGLTPDIALCSVYLTVCAKTGKFNEAYEFLNIDSPNSMQQRWPNAKPPIKPNLITAMNFLVACAECGEFEAAKQLLFNVDGKSSWLSRWGLTPNIALCSVYLTVCAKTGKFSEAYEFLNIDSSNNMQRRWPKSPIKPNLITATNFLVACAECGELEAAKQLLFDVDGQPSWLSRWGLTPDIALGNVYLTVCAKTGKFSEAYEFLNIDSSNNMQRRWPNAKPSIKPDLITAMNFLVACAECGELEAAKRLLFGVDDQPSWLSRWGLTPDIALCSVYLTVCAKTGKFNEAYEFLNIDSPNSMQQRWPNAKPPIKPNLITATNFLVACAECGEFEAAKQLLFDVDGQPSWLSRWGLTPDIALCNAYLMVCAKDKRLDEALELVDKCLPAWGLKANHVTYSHLAVVNLDQFETMLNTGIQAGIYYPSLGLVDEQLDFHVNKIFKLDLTPGAVPLAFAKALFCYHYRKGESKIKRIVTGFNLGQKLRDEFSQFLSNEFNLKSNVHVNNLGAISIEQH